MRLETHQLFAQLCEGILNEASTAMDLIKNTTGGKEVVQKLHRDLGLKHDFTFKEIPKILWSDLKDSYRGAWVIMAGQKGTAAIKAEGGNTGSYIAVANGGGETRVVKDSRGGNVLDFIKGEIGKPVKFYTAQNTRDVADIRDTRASRRQGKDTTINQETLVAKFKPLWIKAMTASIADIKGHVANMIKNDAFEKAKRKLEYIESLQNGLEALEAGESDAPHYIKAAVNTAVLMAASHYYPEQTGEITRGYSRGYTSANSEGPRQLLQDISEGDTSKLGTILAFFKKALISG